MTNKDEDKWRYLEDFDIVGLVETWMEEGKWKKIEDKLSKKFIEKFMEKCSNGQRREEKKSERRDVNSDKERDGRGKG